MTYHENELCEGNRVMVDIETLGLDPGAAILSIGAVRFDTAGLGQEYYRNVDLKSCEAAGLEIDAGTLDWWLSQDEEVQDVLTGGIELEAVLREFSHEYYGHADEIWANSPSFDCDILAAAYEAVGQDTPWHYSDERCCRTLFSLPMAPEIDREGDHHNALDDAKHQARVASATLAKLDGVRTDD